MNAIQKQTKEAAKVLVSLYIDDEKAVLEAVKVARIPEKDLAPGLLEALEKMVEIFGSANPPGVGLTVGDITCDQAREAITNARKERI